MGLKIGNHELGDQKFGVYYVENEQHSLVCYFDDKQEASSYAESLSNTRISREDISEEEKINVTYRVIKVIAKLGINASGIYTGIDWHRADDEAEESS
jgi:hypothetical protein